MGRNLDFTDSSYVFDVVRFACVASVSLPIRYGETTQSIPPVNNGNLDLTIKQRTGDLAPFVRSRPDKNALSRIMAAFSAMMTNGG